MKKLFLVLTLSLLPLTTLKAAGPYDGIWQLPGGIFATMNQNGDNLAVILLEGAAWQAQAGTLSGNVATLSTAIGYVQITARVVFDTTTHGTVTILSCADTATGTCLFQAGAELEAIKVW